MVLATGLEPERLAAMASKAIISHYGSDHYDGAGVKQFVSGGIFQ
jgi:hypothetical protein